METPVPKRVGCAGGIVFDADRRLLLIRRAQPPSAGRWSIPGGKCEPGESTIAACTREVLEETGLVVRVLRLAGRVERPGPDGVVFDIDDYVCAVVGGQLAAGDDASAAAWATRADLASVELVPDLIEALRGWDALPD